MSSIGNRRLRDLAAGGILFAATSAAILWQNAHLVVLWDLSYVLDTATRIALGQMPYRDFPLAHAPLTFLLQAAIVRLTGRVFFHHAMYAAAAGGLGSVLAWRIVLHTLRGRLKHAWTLSVLLTAPLTVLGIYCIFPHPSYDCDCAIAILAAILLLEKLTPDRGDATRAASPIQCFAAGAAAVVPLFFKQNIGLPLLAIAVSAVMLAACARLVERRRPAGEPGPEGEPGFGGLLAILAGAGAALLAAGIAIHFTAGIGNYLHWTIAFAAQRRMPGLGAMLAVYREPMLLWMLPCVAAGIVLLKTKRGDRPVAKQAAEKGQEASVHDFRGCGKRQEASGHDFSRADKASRMNGALAPEGCIFRVFTRPRAFFRSLFSRAANAAESMRASAPEVHLSCVPRKTRPFSATSKVTHILGHVFRGLKVPAPSGGNRWRDWLGLALVCAPFLWTLFGLYLYDDADERGDSLLALWPLLLILAAALTLWNLRKGITLRALVPGIVLVTINGTLLSQQLWGSTYAIWPLLAILIAEGIAFLGDSRRDGESAMRTGRVAMAAAAVISVTLLVCGGAYTASEERLDYAQRPEGPVLHSSIPQLAGMSATGNYLPEFDELLTYAATNIPANDGLILIPGEDPFYFATGRTPQFPVLLFDPATQPYSPAELRLLAREHGIRWLIVKRDLQIREDPTPQRDATLAALLQDFSLVRRLKEYDVYRRMERN